MKAMTSGLNTGQSVGLSNYNSIENHKKHHKAFLLHMTSDHHGGYVIACLKHCSLSKETRVHDSTLACNNEISAIVEVAEGTASHSLAFDGEDERVATQCSEGMKV